MEILTYLICSFKKHLREKYDEKELEDALDDISQPIGISEYELTKVLREEFKSNLSVVEKIESELSE